MSSYQKKTKIVATVGPASQTKETLLKLAQAGANVFRLNFSHGTHEDHLQRIQAIREINAEHGLNLTILQDLQGPKIRTQLVENNGVELIAGRQLAFVMDETLLGTAERVGTTYTSMYQDVKVGERILMDDGNLEVVVTGIDPHTKEVHTTVVYGGILRSKKGINLPGTKVGLPALTEKDEKDLLFGLEHDVDWIALSFVRAAQEILDVKEKIKAAGKSAKVIAKIEKPEAIENIDEIIAAADGLMVARGDMGVELDGAIVPQLQKMMVQKCILAAKPVIVATQMLESMKDSPRPTRAETSDVANAVLDGASATMLSAESASGQYPLEAVSMMTHIIETVEAQQNTIKIVKGDEAAIYFKNHSLGDYHNADGHYLNDRMIAGACRLARDTDAKAILCITNSGYTAIRVSSHRPKASLYVFTDSKQSLTNMGLLWGARVFFHENNVQDTEATVKGMVDRLVKEGLLVKGDVFVSLLAMPYGSGQKTNTVRIGTV
ncbi:MAG: pyruvate kinase [Cytophagaceae bacterium]|nr:pyruvate kinase [Cytophagaceae bacterium]